MKIIGTDNFNTELVSDHLVAENIPTKLFADCMCEALNAKFCNSDHASTYYIVCEDVHKLYKFEP